MVSTFTSTPFNFICSRCGKCIEGIGAERVNLLKLHIVLVELINSGCFFIITLISTVVTDILAETINVQIVISFIDLFKMPSENMVIFGITPFTGNRAMQLRITIISTVGVETDLVHILVVRIFEHRLTCMFVTVTTQIVTFVRRITVESDTPFSAG